MLRIERKIIGFLQSKILIFGIVFATLLSVALRFSLLPFISGDLYYFLEPWVYSIREEGFYSTFSIHNFDYNTPYLLLLFIVSKLPLDPSDGIKIISFVFDYAMAGAMAWAAYTLLPDNSIRRKELAAAVTYLAAIFLPLPVLNSAVWGQCDSIYTFFLILCLVCMMKEKYPTAFLFFSLALGFKLQAIFILPALGILYFVKRRFSILQFLQAPVYLFLVGLIAYPATKNIFSGITIYINQTKTYPALYMNYPNIYTILQDQSYEIFAVAGFAATAAALFGMMGIILFNKWKLGPDETLQLFIWTTYACVILLPSMHERYGYTSEVMLWLYYFSRPTRRRFAMAFSVNAVAMVAYSYYLFQKDFLPPLLLSMINVTLFFAFTFFMLRDFRLYNEKVAAPSPDAPLLLKVINDTPAQDILFPINETDCPLDQDSPFPINEAEKTLDQDSPFLINETENTLDQDTPFPINETEDTLDQDTPFPINETEDTPPQDSPFPTSM